MARSKPFSARSGNSRRFIRLFTLAATAALSVGLVKPAMSQTLGYAGPSQGTFWSDDRSLPSPQVTPQYDSGSVLPERFRRQVVSFDTREAPGTIVIDTGNTTLYYVLGGGRAIRYGVGVGREGFTWSGVQSISRKAAWPDWHPPAEMIARQPYLPRFVAGGPGNPLGAAAMYLGSSAYRIHGTNDPSTIGKFVSSGCIRLTNEDVQDLFNRVSIGTKVVVLPKSKPIQFEEKLAGRGRLSMNVPPARELSQNIKMSGLY
ncbi:lipoprotein-anchoring transpeptidase ErfK/SrfK [Nitrobacteraceae bacterium AZCC 1564]